MVQVGKNRAAFDDGGQAWGWADVADEPEDSATADKQKTAGETPDRRELIKKLGKTAVLPMLVATFVASDATDAAAS